MPDILKPNFLFAYLSVLQNKVLQYSYISVPIMETLAFPVLQKDARCSFIRQNVC